MIFATFKCDQCGHEAKHPAPGWYLIERSELRVYRCSPHGQLTRRTADPVSTPLFEMPPVEEGDGRAHFCSTRCVSDFFTAIAAKILSA